MLLCPRSHWSEFGHSGELQSQYCTKSHSSSSVIVFVLHYVFISSGASIDGENGTGFGCVWTQRASWSSSKPSGNAVEVVRVAALTPSHTALLCIVWLCFARNAYCRYSVDSFCRTMHDGPLNMFAVMHITGSMMLFSNANASMHIMYQNVWVRDLHGTIRALWQMAQVSFSISKKYIDRMKKYYLVLQGVSMIWTQPRSEPGTRASCYETERPSILERVRRLPNHMPRGLPHSISSLWLWWFLVLHHPCLTCVLWLTKALSALGLTSANGREQRDLQNVTWEVMFLLRHSFFSLALALRDLVVSNSFRFAYSMPVSLKS